MLWQDYLITAACAMMGFALLPSVFSKAKPARLSCIITAVCLTVLTVAFITLGLWLSSIVDFFVAVMWWILLFQQRQRDR